MWVLVPEARLMHGRKGFDDRAEVFFAAGLPLPVEVKQPGIHNHAQVPVFDGGNRNHSGRPHLLQRRQRTNACVTSLVLKRESRQIHLRRFSSRGCLATILSSLLITTLTRRK